MKRNKKPLLIGALAVLLVALVVGGTIAWMTAEDDLTNSFTVGTFNTPGNEPNPDIDDPQNPDKDEDEEESDNENELGGFLFETNWDEKADHKLIPGDPEPKNPNVGVAKGSENPYVFIFVKNNSVQTGQDLATYAPYFEIEKQWKTVDDENTEGIYGSQDVSPTESKANTSAYVDGLFMYVGDQSSSSVPVALNVAAGTATQDSAYTGELFETITIPDGNGEGLVATGANVKVYAYIYGAKNGAQPNEEGSAQAALDAAIKWAEEIKATA